MQRAKVEPYPMLIVVILSLMGFAAAEYNTVHL